MHSRRCLNFHGFYFVAAQPSVKTAKVCTMWKFPAILYRQSICVIYVYMYVQVCNLYVLVMYMYRYAKAGVHVHVLLQYYNVCTVLFWGMRNHLTILSHYIYHLYIMTTNLELFHLIPESTCFTSYLCQLDKRIILCRYIFVHCILHVHNMQ